MEALLNNEDSWLEFINKPFSKIDELFENENNKDPLKLHDLVNKFMRERR